MDGASVSIGGKALTDAVMLRCIHQEPGGVDGRGGRCSSWHINQSRLSVGGPRASNDSQTMLLSYGVHEGHDDSTFIPPPPLPHTHALSNNPRTLETASSLLLPSKAPN